MSKGGIKLPSLTHGVPAQEEVLLVSPVLQPRVPALRYTRCGDTIVPLPNEPPPLLPQVTCSNTATRPRSRSLAAANEAVFIGTAPSIPSSSSIHPQQGRPRRGSQPPMSDQDSVQRYKESAEMGDPEAQFSLAWCYANALGGLSKDEQKATALYHSAARQGHPEAQYNLGILSKDKAEAVEWFSQAANAGRKEAQFALGVCYINGSGVAKDNVQASNWFLMAANQGHVRAMNNLALCYEHGYGVDKSIAQAISWYQKAAAAGHEPAKQVLEKLIHQ